jgi:hypothetical protein
MSDRAQPTPVDRAKPVNRDAQNALRLLALPGMWIGPAGYSEDRISFLPVIRHGAASLWPRIHLEVSSAYVEHDQPGELTQRRMANPAPGVGVCPDRPHLQLIEPVSYVRDSLAGGNSSTGPLARLTC